MHGALGSCLLTQQIERWFMLNLYHIFCIFFCICTMHGALYCNWPQSAHLTTASLADPTNWKRSLQIRFLPLTPLTSTSQSWQLKSIYLLLSTAPTPRNDTPEKDFILDFHCISLYLYWIAAMGFPLDNRSERVKKHKSQAKPRATACAHVLNGTSQVHNNLLYLSVFTLYLYWVCIVFVLYYLYCSHALNGTSPQ